MKQLFSYFIALSIAASAHASTFSISGGAASIPDAPPNAGDWSTGVYNGTVAWSAISVPNPVTSITRIRLNGFQHTFRGDLLIQLRDPADNLYNVIVRPGSDGSAPGDSGDYALGNYEFVPVGTGANVQMGTFDVSPGAYGQFFNSLNGQSATGVNVGLPSISSTAGGIWKLEISDWAQQDTGSFSSWTLEGTDASPLVTPFCFGDGSGSACPCGNSGTAGRGCASSVNPVGALLTHVGVPDVSSDTFVIRGTGMPNAPALYYQGALEQAGGFGTIFGDGLRCTAGTVIRLGTKTNVAGISEYPGPGDPDISVRGLIGATGGTRTYQCWYRNAAAFCTSSTYNLTNGLKAIWAP